MADRTEDAYDKVVEMYMAGSRLSDITRETGIARPTIYYALRRRGITPSRTSRAVDEEVTVAQVLEQLAAANRLIGRLEVENERLTKENARLRARRSK